MRHTAIALICSPDHRTVLMGLHQRGEGKGLLSFVGGKVADKPEFHDETPDQSILREIAEEASITPTTLVHQADIFFDHSHDNSKEDEMMHVYRVDSYKGKVAENPEEFQLIWFATDHPPLATMWPSDRIWLPLLLDNENVFHTITFCYSLSGVIELARHQQSATLRHIAL